MTVISMAFTRNTNHKKRKRAKNHVVLDKDMLDAYTLVYNTSIFFSYYHIDGGMVNVLASSAVDRGFEPRSNQIRDHKIGICGFSVKHAALRGEIVEECENFNHRFFFVWKHSQFWSIIILAKLYQLCLRYRNVCCDWCNLAIFQLNRHWSHWRHILKVNTFPFDYVSTSSRLILVKCSYTSSGSLGALYF